MLYRFIYVKRKFGKQASEKLRHFDAVVRKLAAKEMMTEEDILPLAENPSTRQALFGILEGFNRTDLFPVEYFTAEKGAESFLVNWLEFPTELNASPDEIKLFTKITLQEEGDIFTYYTFKYKKKPRAGHATAEEWMLGVAGPYGPETQPYDIPLRVFSRFNEVGSVTAMEEVEWVHQHINRK